MNDVLERKNNFTKTDNIKSNLLYGFINKAADFTMVIPIYGKNRFLEDVLLNLKQQKTSELVVQVIISDNKPESESNKEIIAMLKKINIPNLAYFCSERLLGIYNNFNRSISLAETKYVGMVHDDDLLVENYYIIIDRLLKKIELLQKKIGMVHAKFNMFYDDKCKTEISDCHSIYKITNFAITQTGSTRTGIPSCGIVFNREAVLETGGFNDAYPCSGDSFLAGVMMSLGYDIYQFEQLTGYYRIAVNTSLRLDICQGFIQEDELFRECWKSKNPLRNIYMTIYRNYFYSIDIDNKISNFSKCNPQITMEALDYKKTYKSYHKMGALSMFYIMGSVVRKIVQKFFTIYF